jgi:hypothetical protein
LPPDLAGTSHSTGGLSELQISYSSKIELDTESKEHTNLKTVVEVLCQGVQLGIDLQFFSTGTVNKKMCP